MSEKNNLILFKNTFDKWIITRVFIFSLVLILIFVQENILFFKMSTWRVDFLAMAFNRFDHKKFRFNRKCSRFQTKQFFALHI